MSRNRGRDGGGLESPAQHVAAVAPEPVTSADAEKMAASQESKAKLEAGGGVNDGGPQTTASLAPVEEVGQHPRREERTHAPNGAPELPDGSILAASGDDAPATGHADSARPAVFADGSPPAASATRSAALSQDGEGRRILHLQLPQQMTTRPPAGQQSPALRETGPGAPPHKPKEDAAYIDRTLRERVDEDIAAFLAAFDAALAGDTLESRAQLREATDRLLRAGARTRIELERLEARVPLATRGEGGHAAPPWRAR